MKREELLHALEIVKPGLARKEHIEQSTSFAFINGYVITYNDEISIRHPVGGLELTGAIEADKFYKLLSKLKQDEISIEASGNEVILKSGKAKAGFTMEAKIRLPLGEVSGELAWKRLPDNFIPAITFALEVCSKDSTRPILTCISVNKNGNVDATDSFRIVRTALTPFPVESFLLPGSEARQLLKYKLRGIAESKNWIHFKTAEKTIISCRLFDGTFPNIDPILKVDGTELEFPKTLLGILERSNIFYKESTVIQTMDLHIADNKLLIKAEADSSWFEEEANIKYTGEPISIKIAPSLFKAILEQTRTAILGEKKIRFSKDNWEYVAAILV